MQPEALTEKVRAMMDDKGRRGKKRDRPCRWKFRLNDVPNAGEVFGDARMRKEARNFW